MAADKRCGCLFRVGYGRPRRAVIGQERTFDIGAKIVDNPAIDSSATAFKLSPVISSR